MTSQTEVHAVQLQRRGEHNTSMALPVCPHVMTRRVSRRPLALVVGDEELDRFGLQRDTFTTR